MPHTYFMKARRTRLQLRSLLWVILSSLAVGTLKSQALSDPLQPDTQQVKKLLELGQRYYFSQPDSSLFYSLQALDRARKLNDPVLQARALNNTGESYRFLGDYPKSIRNQFTAQDMYRDLKDVPNERLTSIYIGFSHLEMGDYKRALDYLLPVQKFMEGNDERFFDCFSSSHIGYAYLMLGMPDSAMWFSQRAYDSLKADFPPALQSLVTSRLGRVYEMKGQPDEAIRLYHASLANSRKFGVQVHISRVYSFLANLYADLGHTDSALYYCRATLASSLGTGQRPQALSAASILTELFRKQGEMDSAFIYQSRVLALKDSLYGADQFRDLQVFMLDEQRKQQKLEEERTAQRNRYLFSVLGISALALGLLAWTQYRSSQHKSETNRLLTTQKKQIEETLRQLKVTQAQLVQSEKMASLGELTAGIAHEIQNPLNFVNNFSDLNREMIDELKDELKKGDLQQATQLSESIRENEEKINLHGKRADGIVKSMLQHSRSSSGVKEPTDVNKMVEEYVRMAYHGYRAKQKDFNVKLEIELEPALGKVNMVSQDIGRVILNLLNNAFYAVHEKAKTAGLDYTPTVWIRTKSSHLESVIWNPQSVSIEVADNGPGIPEQVKEKIFQPFFTTKPTGQGTGLGLSLSYDIVTKGHGGAMHMDTKAEGGTRFTVSLPSS